MTEIKDNKKELLTRESGKFRNKGADYEFDAN